MKQVKIEERKLKYILEQTNTSLVYIDSMFEKIDKIMSNLKIGDKIYIDDCYGDIFENTVVEIIDSDNGIVKMHEVGIDTTTIQNVYFCLNTNGEPLWASYE